MRPLRRGLAVLALVLLLAGCAAASAPAPARREPAPRVRCLGDPDRTGTAPMSRPLFFFFCIESP